MTGAEPDVKDWTVPLDPRGRVMWPTHTDWGNCTPAQKCAWAVTFKEDADEHAVGPHPSLRQQIAESLLVEAGRATA